MRFFLSTFIFILLNVISEGKLYPNILAPSSLQKYVVQKPIFNRSFVGDKVKNVFLKDGLPYQVIGGEFEYFRAHPLKWRPIMRLMRAAGINTLCFYVDWALHNPQDGEFVWTGIADVVKFIQIAAEEDLLVMFRVGPFISAEINSGGLPYWLLAKYPHIIVRSRDPDYMREVEIWYSKLMPRILPYLYKNGGPIIMVQVENQYGQFGCDPDYLIWARDLTVKYVGEDHVLITNNLVDFAHIACTKLSNLLTALDFMPGTNQTINAYWKSLRKYHPKGPLLVTEFYTEWTPIWQQKKTNYIDAKAITNNLRSMLKGGASVNLYIMYGGTSFGLMSGSSLAYGPFTTSYGNGGPIEVTGFVGEKYYEIRNVIRQFFPVPDIPIVNPTRMTLPSIKMQPITTLFSPLSRQTLAGIRTVSKKPITFEQLRQDVGFVLYETVLPESSDNPSTLNIPYFFDRAYVYVNNKLITLLNKMKRSTEFNVVPGQTLQILVENNGRLTSSVYNRTYGIIGDALLNDLVLNNWVITGFPFSKLDNDPRLNKLLNAVPVVRQDPTVLSRMLNRKTALFSSEPIIFKESFYVNQVEISDTFVNPTGWGKGFIYINGFNIGRYWPISGPQITLYVPKEILVRGRNTMVIVEFGMAPINNVIQFSETSIFRINGTQIVHNY